MTPSPTRERPLQIAIGIPSYKRPEGLHRLLLSLSRLRFDGIPKPDGWVLVVDNDPAGSARSVVENLDAALPWPLRYAMEPRPGVAHVRNRIVALAGELAMDFIAFIDDDEEATPEWLAQLLTVQARYNASLVSGPVHPRYPPGTPAWIMESNFFCQRTKIRAEGTTPDWGGTGNLLINQRMLAAMEGPFDPRLGLTGGEDTHLFARIRQSPEWRWVWAPQALALEHLTPERTTLAWMCKRQFRIGNSHAMITLYTGSPAAWRWKMAWKGMDYLLYSLILLARGCHRGRAGWLKSAYSFMYGLGLLAAILGYQYASYGRSRPK